MTSSMKLTTDNWEMDR